MPGVDQLTSFWMIPVPRRDSVTEGACFIVDQDEAWGRSIIAGEVGRNKGSLPWL